MFITHFWFPSNFFRLQFQCWYHYKNYVIKYLLIWKPNNFMQVCTMFYYWEENFVWNRPVNQSPHCVNYATTSTDSTRGLFHFTNINQMWALQNIFSKFMYLRNHISYENFKLKLCMCTQSHALGTSTKFQLEILNINVISGIVYFHEIILESSRTVSETPPWIMD